MCPGSYIFLPPYIKHDIRAFMAIFILTVFMVTGNVGTCEEQAAGAVELNLMLHWFSVTFYLLYFLL